MSFALNTRISKLCLIYGARAALQITFGLLSYGGVRHWFGMNSHISRPLKKFSFSFVMTLSASKYLMKHCLRQVPSVALKFYEASVKLHLLMHASLTSKPVVKFAFVLSILSTFES